MQSPPPMIFWLVMKIIFILIITLVLLIIRERFGFINNHWLMFLVLFLHDEWMNGWMDGWIGDDHRVVYYGRIHWKQETTKRKMKNRIGLCLQCRLIEWSVFHFVVVITLYYIALHCVLISWMDSVMSLTQQSIIIIIIIILQNNNNNNNNWSLWRITMS